MLFDDNVETKNNAVSELNKDPNVSKNYLARASKDQEDGAHSVLKIQALLKKWL